MGVQFHYPTDIKLKNSPLVEAWLEIRWDLEPDKALGMPTDPSYPFALGIFYNSVKDEFGYQDILPSSQIPGSIPYLIQHRFRTEKDGWPLLQLGPGIATLNFSKAYSWTTFKNRALYFRSKLISAYQNTKLKSSTIYLRYRNVHPYEYSSQSLLDFLEKLNIQIRLPQNIPGIASKEKFPSQENLLFQFDLSDPKSTGHIQVASGSGKRDNGPDEEVILWEIGVGSTNQDAPDINDEAAFIKWLDAAHAVLHEWFFSLIDGELFNMFSSKG